MKKPFRAKAHSKQGGATPPHATPPSAPDEAQTEVEPPAPAPPGVYLRPGSPVEGAFRYMFGSGN